MHVSNPGYIENIITILTPSSKAFFVSIECVHILIYHKSSHILVEVKSVSQEKSVTINHFSMTMVAEMTFSSG